MHIPNSPVDANIHAHTHTPFISLLAFIKHLFNILSLMIKPFCCKMMKVPAIVLYIFIKLCTHNFASYDDMF